MLKSKLMLWKTFETFSEVWYRASFLGVDKLPQKSKK
jgi:hypothetical protein